MEVYFGQALFILGIVMPMVIVCCLRWICVNYKRNHGANPSNAGSAASAAGQPGRPGRPATVQEVHGLHRTMSYFDPPNGDPPPSYETVLQHSSAPTLTYVDEGGHAKHVKWDGTGSIPTRTVLGQYNPAYEMAEDSSSLEQDLADNTPSVASNE